MGAGTPVRPKVVSCVRVHAAGASAAPEINSTISNFRIITSRPEGARARARRRPEGAFYSERCEKSRRLVSLTTVRPRESGRASPEAALASLLDGRGVSREPFCRFTPYQQVLLELGLNLLHLGQKPSCLRQQGIVTLAGKLRDQLGLPGQALPAFLHMPFRHGEQGLFVHPQGDYSGQNCDRIPFCVSKASDGHTL